MTANTPGDGPRILALDTSSTHCSVALGVGPEILMEYNFLANNDLSTKLLPAIEFVLKSLKWELSDIALFGVGTGPGLFTGIRVGLSTLKGLNFRLRRPIVAILTLEAVARKYQDTRSTVVPILDARRREVYTAAYHLTDGDLEELLPPALVPLDELPGMLHPLEPFKFVGDAIDIHRDFLATHFPGTKRRHRSSFLATEICQLAYHRYQKKDYLRNTEDLTPYYLRKPDAEEKRIPPPTRDPSGSDG